LLVSVRNVEEAAAALAGGADWIDLKEPLAGPLGAAPLDTAREVVAMVAGRLPISAALGELLSWPAARCLLDVPGIEVVKLGLSGCATRSDWPRLWQTAADVVQDAGKQLVAVVYADWNRAEAPSPEEVVAQAQGAQCRYLLVDTFDKTAGSIFDHLAGDALAAILRRAIDASLRVVVAGGLSLASLSELPHVDIELIAVRGGVCAGKRTGRVQQQRVAEFRQTIDDRWSKRLS